MASPSMTPARRPGIAPAAGAPTLRPGALVQRVLSLMVEWNDRYRQRIHVGQLDDRMLRDMGLTRSDALREYDKPFWRG